MLVQRRQRRHRIFYGVKNMGASEAPLLKPILYDVIIFTLLLSSLNHHLHTAKAALTERPQNTTAIVGDVVLLRCSTDLGPSRPVAWYWLQCRSSNEPSPVYLDGSVKPQFVHKMFVNKTEDGQYVLVVKDAQLSDGGTFTCIDDNNFGNAQREKAELVVIGDRLRCQHNLGICNVTDYDHHGEINVTCHVEYAGSVAPEVEWKQVGGDDLQHRIVSKPNLLVSSLVFPIDKHFNSSRFSCQLVHEFDLTKWTPHLSVANGMILPIYYNEFLQHPCFPAVDQQCSINEDVSCLHGSHYWITGRYDLGIQLTLLNISSANMDISQSFQCTTNCSVGDSCKGDASQKFEVACIRQQIDIPKQSHKTLAIVLGVVAAAIVIIIIACSCCRNKKKLNNVDERFWHQEAGMTKEEEQEFDSAFENGGLDECLRLYHRSCCSWKNVPIRIALIGNSGVGKSTFINTACGREPTDSDAAEVGIFEKTSSPRGYLAGDNKLIEWFDLPGIGTVTFNVTDYFSKINIDDYDCFLVITATRFTEIDKQVGLEICNRTKQFYFIRSKVDLDVANEQRDHGKNRDEVLDEIKERSLAQLKSEHFDQPLFLIDCRQKELFEFEALLAQIDRDLPEIKCRVTILSKNVNSEYAIKEEKCAELKGGIKNFMPTLQRQRCPFTRSCKNFMRMYTVCNINFRQLGLDRPSLIRRAAGLHADVAEIEKIVLAVTPQMLDTDWLHFDIAGPDIAIGESWWAIAGFMLPYVGQQEFNRFMLDVLKKVVDKLADTSIEVTRCLKRTELRRSATASENANANANGH